jgi:hypothetical protein
MRKEFLDQIKKYVFLYFELFLAKMAVFGSQNVEWSLYKVKKIFFSK